MRVYLAHQISGLSGEEVFKYFDTTSKELRSMGYDIFSPMTGKGYFRVEKEFKAKDYGMPISTNHAIWERDMFMVRNSDIIFMDLSGMKSVSIGCMMELSLASSLNKHTILVMEKDNPHQHGFVLEAADVVFETHADALKYLSDFLIQQSGK